MDVAYLFIDEVTSVSLIYESPHRAVSKEI